MQNKDQKTYSSIAASEVLKKLDSDEKGLSREEARKRLLKFGPNKLPEAKSDSLIKIFIRQFKSPLIYILLLASGIVFLTGETTDGFIILFVIFFNAIVGAFQEGKAQNTLAALRRLAKTSATVIREGEERIVSDEDLVVGDIIIVREGEKVPADARIIFSSALKINESSLTGESSPVHKISSAGKNIETSITGTENIIFKGTNVTSGMGKAVVIAIAADTVIGGITKEIAELESDLPLKKNIDQLSRFIIMAVGVIAVFLAFLGYMKGVGIWELFAMIVAISVSIIPEGLPIVVTLVLATGVWNMSKKHVLVKNLPAVEALGQTTIIAVDKTGTITKNELMVEKLHINGKLFEVSGFGYDSKGEIRFEDEIIEPIKHEELLLAGKIAILSSTAYLSYSSKKKKWRVSGDPTEASIMVLGKKIGFTKEALEKEMSKIDEMPFKYELKYHAALHADASKTLLSIVGAPEAVLKISDKIWRDGKEVGIAQKDHKELMAVQDSMSQEGLRVVAFAYKHEKKDVKEISGNASQLVFGGFFGIMDGLKRNIAQSVARVNSSGIKLVMITGDYEVTAEAIARKAGIFSEGDQILTGSEIEKMDELELSEKMERVTVFARVTPDHKLKIINAYKLRGDIIAMTGDGVNDALSLAAADIGVSMGKMGTEVAKEASDIILLNDNFSSIVSGIEEGRNIFKTIKRVILYLFSTNLGELLTIIGSLIIGLPLPVMAAQILWLNLVTDGFLDVSLAMEPRRKGSLSKRFSLKKDGLVDKLMIQRMFFMALPMAMGTIFLFSKFYESDMVKGWTVSLTTLAVFQWFNAWNCRAENKSILQINFLANRYLLGTTFIVIILQMLAIYDPFMQKILKTTSLGIAEWIWIVPVASSIIISEEIRKYFWRRYHKK